MKLSDGAERIGAGFHRVAAIAAMDVQVDEARREEPAAQVALFTRWFVRRTRDPADASVAHRQRTANNLLGKNQLCVGECHTKRRARSDAPCLHGWAFFNDARYSIKSTNSCVLMVCCKPAGMMEVLD